jgi:hypothetical protein
MRKSEEEEYNVAVGMWVCAWHHPRSYKPAAQGRFNQPEEAAGTRRVTRNSTQQMEP